MSAILILSGFQMVLTGVFADWINSNRSLLETCSWRTRKMECGQNRQTCDQDDREAGLMYDSADG